MNERPFTDFNQRLIAEANLLDAAHRWSTAALACSVVFVVMGGVYLVTNAGFPIFAVSGIIGAVARLRAHVLVGRARVFRELREGRLH